MSIKSHLTFILILFYTIRRAQKKGCYMKSSYKSSSLILIIFFLGLIPLPGSSKILSHPEYQFPYMDPYIATIASALPMSNMEYEILKITMLPERKELPLFENRHEVGLTLMEQKNKKAPLAFVISGTGGSALSDKSLLIAEQLHQMGYHVVTLPNPVNFHYVIGVSKTGLPGYLPRDAKEYYQFLNHIKNYVLNIQKLKVSHYSVIGYSLGGLMAGFLAEQDEQLKNFNFNRIVMLNPALDLNFAIHQLDSFYQAGDNISEHKKNNLMGKIINFGIDVIERKPSQAIIVNSIQKMKFELNEKLWLIGESFRRDLGDVILASQQIHDNGVLKTPITRYRMNMRENEIHGINFSAYIEKFLIPSLPSELRSLPTSTLLEQTSIYALKDLFVKNKNIYIFDNTDDFLLQPSDFTFLNDYFDDSHLYLYPSGGHCGNYWMDENKNDFRSVMKLN